MRVCLLSSGVQNGIAINTWNFDYTFALYTVRASSKIRRDKTTGLILNEIHILVRIS